MPVTAEESADRDRMTRHRGEELPGAGEDHAGQRPPWALISLALSFRNRAALL